MKNGFVEPANSQADELEFIINKLPVRDNIKEWLCSLLPAKTMVFCPPDFETNLLKIIKYFKDKIHWSFHDAFKCWFLFCDPLLLDCFDSKKIENEKINCIPDLFQLMQNGNGKIFISWTADILYEIIRYADENTEFGNKYRQILNENRKASTIAERVINYIALQKFSQLVDGENLPSWIEIDRITCEGNYPFNLIEEMEDMYESDTDGIPVFLFPRVLLLPFLVHGIEMYKQIHCILNVIGCVLWQNNLRFTGNVRELTDKIMPSINIPKWNKDNHVHWIFFDLAAVSRDLSIIDKVLDGVEAAEIPRIFFEYILHRKNWGKVLAEDYRISNKTEFRWDNVYSNWMSQFILSDNDVFYLFFDYLEKVASETPQNKIALFQELFLPVTPNRYFDDKPIKTELHEVLYYVEGKNTLRDKLIDVIAQGMTIYSVRDILSIERIKTGEVLTGNNEEYELDIFISYLDNFFKTKASNAGTQKDSIFIAEFWYLYLINCRSRNTDNASRIEKISGLIYKNCFFPYCDNENFLYQFLSVPFKLEYNNNLGNQLLWLADYLACWVCRPNKPTGLEKYNNAAELILQRKVVFPQIIADLIREKAELILKFEKNMFAELSYVTELLLAAYFYTDGDTTHKQLISETNRNRELQYKLYYIKYRNCHDVFIPDQFINFLLSLNPETIFSSSILTGNNSYPIELLRYACDAGNIPKSAVIEKLSCFITSKTGNSSEQSISLLREIRSNLEYFFIADDAECNSARETFFTEFYNRAVNEAEDSFTNLYCFLFLWSYFNQSLETLLNKHHDWIPILCTRCSKSLFLLRKNVNQEFSVPCAIYADKDYLFLPAFFLGNKVSLWKGLKPLISIFRAAQIPMLQGNLSCPSFYNLPGEITSFFHHKDQEKLRQLRKDMASDFIIYLKPAKNHRNEGDYSKTEIESEGFDLSLTEPSWFWRYAYIRALIDLGVKSDNRGNFIHNTLEYVSKNDLSDTVKKAAEKARNELNSLRKGMAGGNSKKLLYEAFWWLRQAHLLSLGNDIDQAAALKTRIVEWR